MATKGTSAGECLTYGVCLTLAGGIFGASGAVLTDGDLGLLGAILLGMGGLVSVVGVLTLQVGIIAKGVQIGNRG